jgi:hypothetical protein
MKLHFLCWTSFTFSFIFYFLLPITNSSPTSAAVPKRRLKILIYNPSLGWSHSQFLGAIGDTLEAAGHEVVCLLAYNKFGYKGCDKSSDNFGSFAY